MSIGLFCTEAVLCIGVSVVMLQQMLTNDTVKWRCVLDVRSSVCI